MMGGGGGQPGKTIKYGGGEEEDKEEDKMEELLKQGCSIKMYLTKIPLFAAFASLLVVAVVSPLYASRVSLLVHENVRIVKYFIT